MHLNIRSNAASGGKIPILESHKTFNNKVAGFIYNFDMLFHSHTFKLFLLLEWGEKIEFCELVRFDNVAKSEIYNGTCRRFIDVCMRLPNGNLSNTHAPHPDTHTHNSNYDCFFLRLST